VRADLPIRLVLLATELGFAARLALESLDGMEGMDLLCARVLRPAGSTGVELVLDPPRALPEARRPDPRTPPAAPRSRFRTRLTDADLGMGGDEPA
jgi:hypothetical protein